MSHISWEAPKSLCSQAWPWTSNPPVLTIIPGVLHLHSAQRFTHAKQELHPLSKSPASRQQVLIHRYYFPLLPCGKSQDRCFWLSSSARFPASWVVVWTQRQATCGGNHDNRGTDETLAAILYLVITAIIIAMLYIQRPLKALTFHTVHIRPEQINIYSSNYVEYTIGAPQGENVTLPVSQR